MRRFGKFLAKWFFDKFPYEGKVRMAAYLLVGWWAWVDLNHRPRPYQASVVRFYNNLQNRGDCQATRKSYKTQVFVGWVVGWKKSTNCEAAAPIHFLESRSE